jgi:D-aminoacyl-tRNA deacylase
METFFSRQRTSILEGLDMILLVASRRDTAGVNIARHILNQYPFSKTDKVFQENPVYLAEIDGKRVNLITLKEETINAQDLPNHFADLDLVVFISKHSSASGTPTLSVHTPGNFGAAELGGLPRKVSVSPGVALRDALKALARFRAEMKLNYEVSYECTHHGPSLNVPSMFVELGSSEKQWSDSEAAEAVARAAMESIVRFGVSELAAVLGIGGPHYNQRFTQMALEGGLIFGHIIPKYAVQWVDAEILSQCVERTLEKVDCAILDWKGVRGVDKPKLLAALGEIGLQYRKI